jgi:hypothetical protein
MTIQFLRQVLLGGAFMVATFTAPAAYAGVPIKINVYGVHQGGQILYRYQIENNSYSIIHHVRLGLNAVGKELPGKPWSLNPDYSDVPVPLDAAHCKPFYYMDCTIAVYQFDYMTEPKTNIFMEGIENNLAPPPKIFSGANYIRPGTLSSVAELYIPAAYQSPGYLTASGEVFLLDNNTKNPDGTVVTSIEIPFTQVDVTPPTLSFTLTPATLWPPNGKLVSVTAVITVTDDYDPEPEIKLESITANETLEAEDIRDASFGTDDRNFKLRAERKGKEDDHKQTDRGTKQLGRIYTVTYSATDASGNKSTASATVTVPHDQEEKEKAEDKNKGKQDR